MLSLDRVLKDGAEEFETTLQSGPRKGQQVVLRLVNFRREVNEEEIRAYRDQEHLRAVDQHEFHSFFNQHMGGEGTNADICAFSVTRGNEETGGFATTVYFKSGTGKVQFVENWTVPLWGTENCFLFAKK